MINNRLIRVIYIILLIAYRVLIIYFGLNESDKNKMKTNKSFEETWKDYNVENFHYLQSELFSSGQMYALIYMRYFKRLVWNKRKDITYLQYDK